MKPNLPNSGTSIPRPPEARGFRVEQLLLEAASGRLRVPAFQRPLRWRTRNVVEFFDSIRRGFPVGELLFSRAPAKAATVHYGSLEVDSPEQHSALWVVDGQQRIVALAATMLRTEQVPRGDRWSIWYDLEAEQFVRLSKREAPEGWIPLNVLADSVKLMRWIRAWPYAQEHDVLVQRAFELGKAVREFEIPAYVVEGVSESVLRLIFTRVNTGGVEMRESEVFEALYGKEGEKPIRSAVARLSETGFGCLDEDLFLRCLRTLPDGLREGPDSLTNDPPPDAIRRTEAALRRAIVAFKEAAGIPDWRLMPYRTPLIFLTAFYDRFPQDDARVDRLVARWIWRGALTGEHENSSNARIQRLVHHLKDAKSASTVALSLIEEDADGECARADLQNDPLAEVDREVNLRRAASKVFVLGLLAAHPRRPATTRQLDLFDADFDELLSDADGERADSGRTDATRLYESLTGESLASDIVIKLPDTRVDEILQADSATLSSFLLDDTCVRRLADKDRDEFRAHRRTLLADHLRRFVADRWGDTEELRPSIREIAAAVVS